jgi:anti-sigma regulatory factor (Ser/Thr protein kinase)
MLTIPGRFDRLEQIARFVDQNGRAAGLDEVAICRCQLAVDEACTNIIEHGYSGEDRGDIEITCEGGDGELVITLSDHAPPFDPGAVPPPVLATGIDDAPVGGLGLFFMKQVMDAVEFRRDDGCNRLVLVKRRES